MKRLFKIIRLGDLVRINSNCPNTCKPIYKVYGTLKTKKGTFYILKNERGLHKHLFTKEELILLWHKKNLKRI